MPNKSKTNGRHAGGRPQKIDKGKFSQITCVLRRDTIERLREGAGSKHFGEYLQNHLDRYPPPDRAQYLWLTERREHFVTIKRHKVPVIYAQEPQWKTEEEKMWYLQQEREAKRKAREERRLARMSPQEREHKERAERILNKAMADVHEDLARKAD